MNLKVKSRSADPPWSIWLKVLNNRNLKWTSEQEINDLSRRMAVFCKENMLSAMSRKEVLVSFKIHFELKFLVLMKSVNVIALSVAIITSSTKYLTHFWFKLPKILSLLLHKYYLRVVPKGSRGIWKWPVFATNVNFSLSSCTNLT